MALFQRKPDLPVDLIPAWRAFLDCAEVIEAGRRTLLSTLPVGRVEPAPIAAGVDALRRSLEDANAWMPGWSTVRELQDDHADCLAAMAQAVDNLDAVVQTAQTTGELEVLQTAVEDVIVPLDTLADAERTWRRTWKIPRD